MTQHRVANEVVEAALEWRYATKRFDPSKKITDKDWATLEHSLRAAPSSFGLQPWLFVTVANPELRSALRPHSWNQPQVVEASHFVVLAARTSVDEAYVDSYVRTISEVRGVPTSALEGYRAMMNGFISSLTAPGSVEAWCTHQVYLGLGMLLSSAALLGIDACPLEGIDRVAYNELLDLPRRGFAAKVAVALGYRAPDDELAQMAKVRFPAQHVFERR